VKRPEFPRRYPIHVTLKIREGVGNLRTNKIFAQIKKAFFHGHKRFGMQMVEFSVQANHIHLVVEAESRECLCRGMRGLNVRIARAVNKIIERKGKVFADRYHAHVLRTLAEVRNAVNYLRNNFRKHRPGTIFDPYSSTCGEACWYDWGELVIAAPRTWLLKQAV